NRNLARLGRYAANIFHEIKNIRLLPKIDRLRSLLEDAADLMVEPSAAHRLELIQMTLSALSRDAQSLRGMSGRYSAALARLDKFQLEESGEICINAVLRTLVKELDVELENRKINCFLKEDNESHYIRGDQDLLSIAFRNIMLNAIEAIEAKGGGIGEIRVSMSKKGQLLEVAIADNGIGMEKTMKDRVLRERFFTTKRGGLGGLGLPIAKSIIEKHDGELHPPQSMVGKGSVFIMEFRIFRSIPYQEG
ncbi:MAG: HAMP domain-containing sensor histidine kinase, partial [Deltaproteobacteria bacterium]|nr:HAMP domain-containing sensor histidine kinase [Deltaproteobacteria bacterium]